MKIIFKGKTTKDDESLEKLGLKETDFLVVMSQVSVSQLLRRNHLPSPKLKKRKRPLNLNLNKNLPTNPQKRRKMVFNHPLRVHKPKSTTWWPWDSLGRSVSQHSEQPMDILTELLSISLEASLLILNRDIHRTTRWLVFRICLSLAKCGQCFKMIQILCPKYWHNLARHLPNSTTYSLIHSDDHAASWAVGEPPHGWHGWIRRRRWWNRCRGRVLWGLRWFRLASGRSDSHQPIGVGSHKQSISNVMQLSDLGFSKIEAAQAYIACDKNE